MRTIYLLLAVAGLVAPYYFFTTFLIQYGLNPTAFFQQLFGTPISAFFAIDVIITAVVFLIFMAREAARRSIPRSWVYVLATLLVGPSFAFPLFLYAREQFPEPAGSGAPERP